MRPYRPLRSVATFLLLVATAPAVRAEESAADVAARGLEQCEEGRASSDRSTRESLFRSGQMLGERISSVLELRRLLSELDRTLALNPDHVKAMATKGILLCRLPRLLGGDAVQGEQMLRRVVAEDPTAVNSRLVLAKQCASRGEHDEALQYASRALQIAREQGRADAVAEAQATLAQLGSAH